MNTGVHVFFWIMVFSRYISSNGTAGLHGSCIFSILSDCFLYLWPHSSLSLFHSITWAFCYFSNASNICSLSSFCSSYSHNLGHSLVANLLTASSLPSFRWLKGHFLWEVFQHTINHCPSLSAFYHVNVLLKGILLWVGQKP